MPFNADGSFTLTQAPGPPRQDWIALNGLRSPGLAEVKGLSVPRKWDTQEPVGYSGAFIIYNGQRLAKFDVEITMTDDDNWDAWDNFARECLEKAPAGVRPKAFDISHPVINMAPWRVKSVVVEDVTQWVQDDTGFFRCTIKFLEFRAPKFVQAKPNQAIPAVAKPQPTAEDLLDDSISREMVTLHRVSGQ